MRRTGCLRGRGRGEGGGIYSAEPHSTSAEAVKSYFCLVSDIALMVLVRERRPLVHRDAFGGSFISVSPQCFYWDGNRKEVE